MALNIRNDEAEKLATAVASMTGETKTEAVIKALRQRLETLKRHRIKKSLSNELEAIIKHCAALPVLDNRGDDEIIGYDEKGLPT